MRKSSLKSSVGKKKKAYDTYLKNKLLFKLHVQFIKKRKMFIYRSAGLHVFPTCDSSKILSVRMLLHALDSEAFHALKSHFGIE